MSEPIRHAVYDDAGRITQFLVTLTPESPPMYGATLQSVICGNDVRQETHWVENGHVIERPPAPASLLDLPVPATVTVRSNALGTSETYTVEDGSFEYSDAPGRYTITVQAWPHLDATFEVTL